MSFIEVALIGVSLSMDTFAVSLSLGLQVRQLRIRDIAKVCLCFGLAQTIMPFLGFLLGSSFAHIVESYSYWIAFVLLALVGGKMIGDSIHEGKEKNDKPAAGKAFTLPRLILLALAESIDALAVGVTFAFAPINIAASCIEIGVITAIIALAGMELGRFFGARFKQAAGIAGGVVLILLGLKTLLEGLRPLIPMPLP
jgi:putative Mn2+ efflux pump MntP